MAYAPNVLITFPHTMGAGGGGTIGCIEIAKHLRAAGAKVTIATVTTMSVDRSLFRNPPLPPEREGREQEAELRDAGVDIVRIAPHPVHYYLDGLPTKKVVKGLLAKQHFDAALGWHQEYAHLPAMLHKHGVITGLFTSGWYRDFKNIRQVAPDTKTRLHVWMQKHLLHTSLKVVDVVFAISKFTRGEVSDSFGIPHDRFQVAHWGVNPVFRDVPRAPDGPIRRFLFYGSADPRKGGLETIEAFAEITKQGYTDWELRMVWAHREQLEAKAAELGVSDRVTAMDPVDHHGLARELERAQCAILPSKFESFGLACAEAHASGVPVIAYDVGGVHEVVLPGETGWLVPNERVDLLPPAILGAMQDAEQTYAMGLAGRKHVTENYAWERTAETILGRLEQIAQAKGSR